MKLLLSHWLRQLGGRLPLLLLTLLAAFSWWVAQEAMWAARPQPARQEPQREADYFLQGFQVRGYAADGRFTSWLSGSALQHIPSDQTLHVTAPVMRAVSAGGIVIDARAQTAISNADGSNVQLLGQAEVNRSAPGQDSLTVRGDFLNLFPQQQKLWTDRPSTIERGGALMGAERLQVDALTGQVTMQGRVSVRLPAKPGHPG